MENVELPTSGNKVGNFKDTRREQSETSGHAAGRIFSPQEEKRT